MDSHNSLRFHPVYKSINKPLTIWGAERRLFFLALIMGGATFNFFGSLVSGLVMFLALYVFARCATATDIQMLRVLLNSSKLGLPCRSTAAMQMGTIAFCCDSGKCS